METHIPIYARTCMAWDEWMMPGQCMVVVSPGAVQPSRFRDRHPAASMAHAQLAPSIFCWVWTARFPDFYFASRMRGGERKTLRKYNIRGRGSCHMLQISRRTTNGCTPAPANGSNILSTGNLSIRLATTVTEHRSYSQTSWRRSVK